MAPTASVLPSPLNAIEKPNWSPSPSTFPILLPVSEALIACWVRVCPVRVKM
jgi:hypothetical protein